MERTGKVWLVGAGPGSAELLTVKASRLLQTGDCIVYDRLVGKEILAMLPAGKELIDVGKDAGHHAVPQSEINRILVREAKRGKNVIRLKGGDPFLFGRGGEELEALREEQIPFEIVPGITSPIAVPAYNGIPVTHRDCVSSVHIITGHRKAGQGGGPDYDALVRAGGTLVFLMGVGALEEIMDGLQSAGMCAETPAAILQQGTTAGQRRVSATAGTLAQAAKEQEIKAPSIIIVGEVCRYAEQFAWYEKLPLAGESVLCPAQHGGKLQEMLKALGAEVLPFPGNHLLRTLIDGPVKAVFTGSSDVEGFVRMLGDDFPYHTVTAVCTGPKTAQTAEKAGMRTAETRSAAPEDVLACIMAVCAGKT